MSFPIEAFPLIGINALPKSIKDIRQFCWNYNAASIHTYCSDTRCWGFKMELPLYLNRRTEERRCGICRKRYLNLPPIFRGLKGTMIFLWIHQDSPHQYFENSPKSGVCKSVKYELCFINIFRISLSLESQIVWNMVIFSSTFSKFS